MDGGFNKTRWRVLLAAMVPGSGGKCVKYFRSRTGGSAQDRTIATYSIYLKDTHPEIIHEAQNFSQRFAR